MEKANIYIIPSSFPYFCAQEAMVHFGKECKNILIPTYPSKRIYKHNCQLENVIDHKLWNEIFYICPHKNRTLTHLQEICITKKIQKKYSIKKIFAADANSFFFHLLISSLNPPETYVIDEGASTLEVYEQLLKEKNQNVFQPPQKSLFTRAMLTLSGLTYKNNCHLKMFTFFNLKSINNVIEIQTHNLSTLKKNDMLPIKEKSLMILGTIEFSDYYIKKLLEIKKRFGSKKIIYVPHRKEKSRNINKIKTVLQCEIDNRPAPVELKIIDYTYQPKVIVGFFSTALASIKVICPGSIFFNSSPDPDYEKTIPTLFKKFFSNYPKC